MPFLRRAESFNLVEYTHPFRFMSKAHEVDATFCQDFEIDDDELDKDLFIKELGNPPEKKKMEGTKRESAIRTCNVYFKTLAWSGFFTPYNSPSILNTSLPLSTTSPKVSTSYCNYLGR